MTLPVWPDGVPSTARDGWQMPQMFDPLVTTAMAGGNQRNRSMPGSNVASITYPLQPLSISNGEWTAFDAFIRTTLGGGASRWTMPIVIAGATVTKTVQFDQGKSPTVTQEGDYMHVTLPLRVYGL